MKGLINHDDGEDIVTGRVSETHADFLSQEDEPVVEFKESEETTTGLAGPEKARVATRMNQQKHGDSF